MRDLFSTPLYIKVYKDSFVIRDLSRQNPERRFSAAQAFTSQRLLVGNFSQAEACLQQAVRTMLPKRFIPRRPAVLIQPMEMIEGGLSQVEERILNELVLGTGAYKVVLWLGRELDDNEAINTLFNRERAHD